MMNKRSIKRSVLSVGAVFLLLTVGIGVPVWQEVRQQRLNRQLLLAVAREDTRSAMAALESGADANAQQSETPVSVWQLIRARIMHRSLSSLQPPTPLLLALQWKDKPAANGDVIFPKENLPLLKLLLAHGARVNVADSGYHSPLCYAVMDGKNASARLLLQHGARVTALPNKSDYPLRDAVSYLDVDADIVEEMLKRGADPNFRDNIGCCPLEWAIITHRADKVKVLLRFHADPNARTNSGKSLLAYAKQFKNIPEMAQTVQMLKDAGAKK